VLSRSEGYLLSLYGPRVVIWQAVDGEWMRTHFKYLLRAKQPEETLAGYLDRRVGRPGHCSAKEFCVS